MDVFSRTFLPAAAEAGVAIPTVSRHMPIFRRCVEPDDSTVLVSRCVNPERPMAGDFLMLLTRRRLVITNETRVLHRLRLHLNANLRHLSNVSWNADPRSTSVDIAATAVDGVRERFRIRLHDSEQVWQIDAQLKRAFRRPVGTVLRLAA
jgi:sugar-specific transcriptional regulator TrmB